MTVRHEDGVEARDDVLGRERQPTVGLRTGFAVCSIGGRASAGSSIGSTRMPPARSSEQQRRVADERDLHAGFLVDSR